ncbi:MAG: hypothetical protein HUU47_02255 [Bacteroidetes bacterium]|nr:hypothetical protein [Bacteroidota bacterium]
MIEINKENFEMIMFDLVEGNIGEPQKSELLNQINNDEFLKKEWELMKLTVLEVDENLIFDNKDKLIKSTGNIKFFNFYIVSSIAASLLLLAIILLKFNKPETRKISIKTDVKSKIEHYKNIEKSKEFLSKKTDKFNISSTTKSRQKPIIKDKNTNEITNFDSINIFKPNYDIIIVKKQNIEKINYSTIYDLEIKETDFMNIEKYKLKNKSKYDILISNTYKIKRVWDDLPNLKIKIIPKVKNYKPSIDITLKGDIIYANATIEIK